MTYILKKGNLFVIGYDLTEDEGKRPELTRVTLSTKYAMRLPYEIASIISDTIDVEVIAVEDSQKLEELNKFLTKKYISLSTLMVITCFMIYSIFFDSLLNSVLFLIMEIISIVETYAIDKMARETWSNG